MEKIITLSDSKKIILQEEVSETTNEVILRELIDNGSEVIAHVIIGGVARPYVLWSGDGYTTIADWTQKQAEDRIKDIFA